MPQTFNEADSGMSMVGGLVRLHQATQIQFGGAMMAQNAEIVAGTDDAVIITPRGLFTQTGLPGASLTTTAKQIVPAINEMHAFMLGLAGILILIGSYNVAGDVVTPGGGGFHPAGALEPATQHNGHYLIITGSGTGTGNAPPVAMRQGDWIVSNGIAWVHLDLAQPDLDAGNIGVAPPIGGQNNVRDVLLYLDAKVVVTDASLAGNGTTGAPLTVAVVDGGDF